MAFFRNDQVNWLNLHYALNALARTGADAFFVAFLLRQGFSVPAALLAMAAILAGRFLVRPLVLPLTKWLGLRTMVILGSILVGAQFPVLAQVRGVNATFYALVVLSAVGDAVYWTCYHAFFAVLGDSHHRGHQLAAREAIAAVAGIAGPLMIGLALTVFGPMTAFGATGAVIALSALPLLATPAAPIARDAPGAVAASLAGAIWFAVDGWTGAGTWIVWQIALFVSLGERYTAFGGAVALASLVGAVSGMALGRLIDKGHGRRAVVVAIGAMMAVVVLRALAFGHPAPAVMAMAAGAVSGALYIPTFMTAVYNQAQRSPCPLRFHLAAEGGYDAGCGAGCLAAAALIAHGVGMGQVLLLPLASLAGVGLMLLRYYAPGPLKPVATM
jgi:hypothetical protein